jgi:alpha-galactosidase
MRIFSASLACAVAVGWPSTAAAATATNTTTTHNTHNRTAPSVDYDDGDASSARVHAALLRSLRNTSVPRLAYSTWVGWYLDGGLNESVLFDQAQAMATHLLPFGWNLMLHDYGWQVCGSTEHPEMGCIRVDGNGRLYPDPERYPSSALPGGRDGDLKPFVDRVHALGVGFGLHLMHGIPKLAVADNLPIANSSFTAADIADTSCATFIPDHWSVNASHPGAAAYYDSVVAKMAAWGVDFIYFDGVPDCGVCHLGSLRLLADSAARLGDGMFIYMSYGDDVVCPIADVFAAGAAYVRVACDTTDSWPTLLSNFEHAPRAAHLTGPGHFPDLASLMVGAVHKDHGPPGPDYIVPSASSALTEDEVVAYASLVAMARSTWWPSGVLTEMTPFMLDLLTNEEVLALAGAPACLPSRVVAADAATGHVWVAAAAAAVAASGSGDACGGGDGGSGGGGGNYDAAEYYVLLANPGNESISVPLTVNASFAELGVVGASCVLRDLWQRQDVGVVAGGLSVPLRRHAAFLGKLSNCTAANGE